MSLNNNQPNSFIRIFNRVWGNIYGKWALILSALAILLIILRAAGITNVVLAVLITMIPLVLAVMISWMLNPIVWRIIKKTNVKPKMARVIVFVTFILTFVGIVTLLIWLFISQFSIFALDMLGDRDVDQVHKYLLNGDIGGLAKFKVGSGSVLFDNKELQDWWTKEIVGQFPISANQITNQTEFNTWLSNHVGYLSTDETIRGWSVNSPTWTSSNSQWAVVNAYVQQLNYSDIDTLNFQRVEEVNGVISYHFNTSDAISKDVLIKIPTEFNSKLRLGSSYHFLIRLLTTNWANSLGLTWVVEIFNWELENTDFGKWIGESFTIAKIVAGVLLTILITIFITWFLIGRFERISIWLTKNLPTKDSDKRYVIAKSVHNSIFGWLKGLAIDELFMLTSVTLLVVIAGVSGGSGIMLKTCIIFGLFYALMNLIPFLGPFLGGAPIVIAAIMEAGNTGTWAPLIIVCIGLIVIQIAEGIWVIPVAYSKQTDLHPVVVVLGVTSFGAIFGLWGMPFAVPVLAMIKSISINAYKWTPFTITGAEVHTHRKVREQRNE